MLLVFASGMTSWIRSCSSCWWKCCKFQVDWAYSLWKFPSSHFSLVLSAGIGHSFGPAELSFWCHCYQSPLVASGLSPITNVWTGSSTLRTCSKAILKCAKELMWSYPWIFFLWLGFVCVCVYACFYLGLVVWFLGCLFFFDFFPQSPTYFTQWNMAVLLTGVLLITDKANWTIL